MNVTIATEDSTTVYYTQALEYKDLPRKDDELWLSFIGHTRYKVLYVRRWFKKLNEFDIDPCGAEVVIEEVKEVKPKKAWWKI